MSSAQGQVHDVTRLANYHDFTSPDNKFGLPIKVEVTSNAIFSNVTIPEHMAGWRAEGVTGAHPGAVATVLATVMGQGVSYRAKRAAWIKSMSVEYYGLVPVGEALRCEAGQIQARGDREQIVDATITDAKGEVLARARGEYHLFDVDELRAPHALLAVGRQVACASAFVAPFEQAVKAIP